MITKNIFPLWDNSDIILSAIKTVILVIWDKISLDTQWKDALPREICEFMFHVICEILKLKGPYNLGELSVEPLIQETLWKLLHFSLFLCPRLNCLANCQTTYKENYGPWGVLGKLHHWQFYLGELQGLDNAPLKYDDRLEGMYPGPFYKLHKTPTAEN